MIRETIACRQRRSWGVKTSGVAVLANRRAEAGTKAQTIVAPPPASSARRLTGVGNCETNSDRVFKCFMGLLRVREGSGIATGPELHVVNTVPPGCPRTQTTQHHLSSCRRQLLILYYITFKNLRVLPMCGFCALWETMLPHGVTTSRGVGTRSVPLSHLIPPKGYFTDAMVICGLLLCFF